MELVRSKKSKYISKMKTLKIAGVPEHFNLPWHLCIENNEFEKFGIHLQWTNVPEGTGRLCKMLSEGTTDIAIILTEGIIKDIIAKNPSKIVQTYVESPLLWGIHVDVNSSLKTISDLENKKVAISRYGSGSHLMSIVHAKQCGWNTNNLKFEVVNTIDGAIKSLATGTADYFMWEHFMTKPLVDAQIFKRLGDFPTPWPSFVIAVRNEILETHSEQIKAILNIINAKTKKFKTIKNIENILALKYNQKVEDINQWLALTKWSQKNLTENEVTTIQNQLFELEIIDKKTTFTSLIKVL